MERPVRIAVIGPVDERLVGDLRRLPLRPEVSRWSAATADCEALLRAQPDLAAVAFDRDAAEEIGALRVLRQLCPSLGLLLISDASNELAMAPLAARLRARLLVFPAAPGQLAAAVEQARTGSDRPAADAFVDLAGGLADEINNPLLFASGHLQLLRASCAGAADSDRRDQINNVMAGLQRIHDAVERMRLMAEAANGPRRLESVDLRERLGAALAARPPSPTAAPVSVADGEHVVTGDRAQLDSAIAALVRFADDLATIGAAVNLHLEALPGARRLRLAASGAPVVKWQLPHTFEPYYPNRALRGQSRGLGLMLAQTVVLGHRGQATAQRLSDGSLQIDLVLPS
jgi:signal transduction histidine kinase